MDANDAKQFRAAAIKQLFLSYVLLLVQLAIFFVSAGEVSFRSWLFFVTSFVHLSLGVIVQYRFNPLLLVQRLKIKREGSKLWDEFVMRASNLMVLVAAPAVAGLDVGRLSWSMFPFYSVWLGFVFFAVSTFLLNWAMVINRHFEPTVRIQESHKVITGGPYKIVRHPGYLAGIFYSLALPLMIGSIFSLIPVGIYVLLIIFRTWFEDNTLKKELDGYAEYTKLTKFRLFPGIW
jgi:protein-S-isoprenylcysteine O-methyltransferase Ste14